jgi:hypothetical protein
LTNILPLIIRWVNLVVDTLAKVATRLWEASMQWLREAILQWLGLRHQVLKDVAAGTTIHATSNSGVGPLTSLSHHLISSEYMCVLETSTAALPAVT